MAIIGHEIHIFIPKSGQNQIFIPKRTEGGGSAGLRIIPKKNIFFNASLI